MWTLAADGDLFQGRRVWLKPGSTHLFGRTGSRNDAGRRDDRSYVIDNKSVSRKHFWVTVAPVEPTETVDVRLRSEITITDDSKVGTYIDNAKLLRRSRSLQKDEHVVKLGSYEQKFRLKWEPCVFTFTTGDRKAVDVAHFAETQAQLLQLDIISISPYVQDHTTHVIASKRNTPKCLQALVGGKHIVTDAYVQAVVDAATASSNAGDPEGPAQSRLEVDFDLNWPDPAKYLPPHGKEPVRRPDDLFRPDTSRSKVFAGFVFIFLEQLQLENLRDPLLSADAEAVRYSLEGGNSTVADFLSFVEQQTGQGNMNPRRRAIVVRLSGQHRVGSWSANFVGEVEQTMNQQAIEQNEFLDAIVMKNASGLIRSVEKEAFDEGETTIIDISSSPVGASSQGPRTSSHIEPPAEPATVRRGPRRVIAQSRFKGFDDFDETRLPLTKDPSASEKEEPVRDAREATAAEEESQGLFVSQEPTAAASNKRQRQPVSYPTTEEVVEGLLPAAAALKRRRLAQPVEQANARLGTAFPTATPVKAASARAEIDVTSFVRRHREAQDETARQEEESLQQAMQDVEIEALTNLVRMEEVAIAPRPSRRQEHRGQGQTWDDRWNGRKNFKGFRKRGTTSALQRPRVIVTLEEVKRNTLGFSNEAWLDESQDLAGGAGAAVKREQLEGHGLRFELDDDGAAREGPDAARPARPASSRQAGSRQAGSRQTSSRQKTVNADDEDDDGSDDGVGFRFRRSRRGG